MSRYGGIGNN